MRSLPFIITSAVVLSGCLGGAGLQSTPPAPIPQSSGSIGNASAQTTSSDTEAEGAATAAASPISAPVEETSIPTGAGGTFLRA